MLETTSITITARKARELGCRRRKARVSIVAEGFEVECYGTFWDGGSRNEYAHINPLTFRQRAIPTPTAPPQHGGGHPPKATVSAGCMVIVGGTFCGKPAFPHIYGTRSDLITAGLIEGGE